MLHSKLPHVRKAPIYHDSPNHPGDLALLRVVPHHDVNGGERFA